MILVSRNVFRGLARNYLFNAVIIVSILLQAFIVEFGGEFTKTTGLSWELWLWSFGLGLVSLPLGKRAHHVQCFGPHLCAPLC